MVRQQRLGLKVPRVAIRMGRYVKIPASSKSSSPTMQMIAKRCRGYPKPLPTYAENRNYPLQMLEALTSMD